MSSLIGVKSQIRPLFDGNHYSSIRFAPKILTTLPHKHHTTMTFQKLTIAFAVLIAIMLGIVGYGQLKPAQAIKTSSTSKAGGIILPADQLAPILADAKIDVKKDYVAVINIWATWCGPCIREIPSLNSIVAKAKGKKIRFIGATSEDEATVTEFWKRREGKLSFDYELALSRNIAEALPYLYAKTKGERIADAIPQHYIIKNNEVIYFHLGGLTSIDEAEMLKKLGLK